MEEFLALKETCADTKFPVNSTTGIEFNQKDKTWTKCTLAVSEFSFNELQVELTYNWT